jgi:hypothetical protein
MGTPLAATGWRPSELTMSPPRLQGAADESNSKALDVQIR